MLLCAWVRHSVCAARTSGNDKLKSKVAQELNAFVNHMTLAR
jgi:hypothetical protein